MLVDGVTNAGAVPVLGMSIQFAARRQELLAHNIANLSTPGFLPMDADPKEFQMALRDAVEARRERRKPGGGTLRWKDTSEVVRDDAGRLSLVPASPSRRTPPPGETKTGRGASKGEVSATATATGR